MGSCSGAVVPAGAARSVAAAAGESPWPA